MPSQTQTMQMRSVSLSITSSSASTAASALGIAIKIVLVADAKLDSTLLDGPRERFWTDTERDFHNLLNDAITQLEAGGDAQTALAGRWCQTLEQAALHIFDETVPLDALGVIDPKRVVEARRLLVLTFKGFGKFGQGLFKELGLPSAKRKEA